MPIHITNMCMRLRNAGKCEPLASTFPVFRAEYTYFGDMDQHGRCTCIMFILQL